MGHDFLSSLIDQACARGAEAAEVYYLESRATLADVKEGRIDTLSKTHLRGMGLRVLKEQRIGFSYISDLGEERERALVDRALTAARESDPDPFLALPVSLKTPYPEVIAYDPILAEISQEEKVEVARKMEASARALDPRVFKVRHALYQDGDHRVTILNSQGIEAEGRGTSCHCSIEVMAEEQGSSEMGWDMTSSAFWADMKAEEVGRRAAEQAVRMLGAKTLPTCRVDVILAPPPAAEFWEVISSALMGDAVQKGKSLFAHREGEKIASACCTLMDDGLLPRGAHSFPFDDEGVPAQRTTLIEAGILQGFLFDSYWAAKAKRSSTGNARRSAFQTPPQIMATNLYALPGERSAEAMMGDLSRGILVLSLMGMHTANPISGDFSVGAEGLWIERGRIQQPFRGVVIAGNIVDFLLSLEEVGSDLRFFGTHGSPSIRVNGIQLAGV